MSYYLADANGYMEDFASIGGLREISKWAAGQGGPVARFFKDGQTNKPEELGPALRGAIGTNNVTKLAAALKLAAERADTVLLVTDGESEASEDLEDLFSDDQARDEGGRWTVQSEGEGGKQVSNHETYMGAVLAANRMADRRQTSHHVHTPSGKRVYTAQPGRSLFDPPIHPNVKTPDKVAKEKIQRQVEHEPKLFSQALRAMADYVKGFAFDRTNPRVKDWAAKHAGELIDGISKTTRDAIRDHVESAFDEQFDVDELADRIAGELGDDEGERADTIARTETMRASNEGQQEAWNQAVDDGVLTGDEKRVWIATDDELLCPICGDLADTEVGLDEEFDDGIDEPPAHPNCRCTMGLV